MKKLNLIKILMMVWMLCILSSCSDEGTEGLVPPMEEGEIGLFFSSGIAVSRAEEGESSLPTLADIEQTVDHLDVFIWNLDGSNNPTTLAHYERIATQGNPSGTKRLSVKKDYFKANVSYRIDVIANATTAASLFETYTQWTQLRNAVQQDFRIQITGGHETGAIGTSIEDVPTRFLMDGIAKLQGASEGTKTAVLNNGDNNNTLLDVTLDRAAAKIVVNLSAGDDITFKKTTYMGYNLRNMPYSTSLLKESTHDPERRKTDFLADDAKIFFNWSEKEVTVTAYVYSHQWNEGDFFDEGTRMTVNLPLVQEGNMYDNSYYQIMLTKGNEFKRNTMYVVDATISAPGGIDSAEPDTLQNLRYSAEQWTTTELEIGNDYRPSYLYVNKDTVGIHNVDTDTETLSFYSSAEVEVSVDNVWYVNKFGQDTSSGEIRYADVKGDTINTTMQALKGIITATPAKGLSGNIGIYSPVPLNNAIRYIELTVKHKNGTLNKKVIVRQYPLEYITNTQGWYSYRSDFGGTTYESFGNAGTIAIHDPYYNSYFDTSGSYEPLFGSKVASLSGNGESDIQWYFWYSNGSKQWYVNKWNVNNYNRVYTPVTKSGTLTGLRNARMYHVRITSSSSQYNVGIPKQTITEEKLIINGKEQVHYNNKTATDAWNNTLVSPSFMIASQLGATQAPADINGAAAHCAQYVETYKDDNGNVQHLTNWRLPTKAEVEIIMKFQYVPNAAMDVVLSGPKYWSAAGLIENKKSPNSSGSIGIRCVRDTY